MSLTISPSASTMSDSQEVRAAAEAQLNDISLNLSALEASSQEERTVNDKIERLSNALYTISGLKSRNVLYSNTGYCASGLIREHFRRLVEIQGWEAQLLQTDHFSRWEVDQQFSKAMEQSREDTRELGNLADRFDQLTSTNRSLSERIETALMNFSSFFKSNSQKLAPLDREAVEQIAKSVDEKQSDLAKKGDWVVFTYAYIRNNR